MLFLLNYFLYSAAELSPISDFAFFGKLGRRPGSRFPPLYAMMGFTPVPGLAKFLQCRGCDDGLIFRLEVALTAAQLDALQDQFRRGQDKNGQALPNGTHRFLDNHQMREVVRARCLTQVTPARTCGGIGPDKALE